MLAVMPPKEMFAPMFSMTRLSAPRITVRFRVGLINLKSDQYSFFQKRHSLLLSTASRPSSTVVARSTRLFCRNRKSAVETTTEMKIVQTTLLGLFRKIAYAAIADTTETIVTRFSCWNISHDTPARIRPTPLIMP